MTYDECDYLALRIRTSFEIGIAQQKPIADELFRLIGEKGSGSILGVINIGIIGVLAFIGYKIIAQKGK